MIARIRRKLNSTVGNDSAVCRKPSIVALSLKNGPDASPGRGPIRPCPFSFRRASTPSTLLPEALIPAARSLASSASSGAAALASSAAASMVAARSAWRCLIRSRSPPRSAACSSSCRSAGNGHLRLLHVSVALTVSTCCLSWRMLPSAWLTDLRTGLRWRQFRDLGTLALKLVLQGRDLLRDFLASSRCRSSSALIAYCSYWRPGPRPSRRAPGPGGGGP